MCKSGIHIEIGIIWYSPSLKHEYLLYYQPDTANPVQEPWSENHPCSRQSYVLDDDAIAILETKVWAKPMVSNDNVPWSGCKTMRISSSQNLGCTIVFEDRADRRNLMTLRLVELATDFWEQGLKLSTNICCTANWIQLNGFFRSAPALEPSSENLLCSRPKLRPWLWSNYHPWDQGVNKTNGIDWQCVWIWV